MWWSAGDWRLDPWAELESEIKSKPKAKPSWGGLRVSSALSEESEREALKWRRFFGFFGQVFGLSVVILAADRAVAAQKEARSPLSIPQNKYFFSDRTTSVVNVSFSYGFLGKYGKTLDHYGRSIKLCEWLIECRVWPKLNKNYKQKEASHDSVLKNARQMLAKRNFYANYETCNYSATSPNCNVQTQPKSL